MSEPIFTRLEHELEGDITKLFHHGRYHDPSVTIPKGPPGMSVIDSIEHELSAAETKAGEVWNHVKTIAEQHLPQAAAVLKAAEDNPVVAAGLRIAHLPPSVLDGAANMLLALEAALGQPAQAAESPAEPSAGPAQPETPAGVPQPVSAGPVVGGTAT